MARTAFVSGCVRWTKILLGPGCVLFGFLITLIGYLSNVFSFGLSQLGWIAVGNIIFMVGAVWAFLTQVNKTHELEARLAPRFEIVFGTGGSFEQEDQWGSGQLFQRLYRIAVVNTSEGASIENVKVQLETTEGFYVPFLPIELHQMHDRLDPPLVSFTLNPQEPKYIDVVSKLEGVVGEEGQFWLHYAIPGIPNCVSPGQYRLGILVTGLHAKPKRRTFNVGVGEHDRLLFLPEDGVLFNA